MKIVLPLLAVPLLLAPPLLAGCRNPAPGYTPVAPAPIEPVQPTAVKTPTALMPLDLGNHWTYDLQNQSFAGEKPLGEQEIEVEYRVVEVSPDGDARVTLESDDKPLDQQIWRSSPEGLFQVASGLKADRFDPAQPLALLPLTAGRKFEWEGRGPLADGRVGHSSLTSEILEPQNVDTEIGTLSAVPVVTRTEYDRGHVDNTTWFRPGIGLIRLRQETITKDGHRDVLLLTLTNYAIKRS